MEDICIVCAEPLQFTAYAGCGHKDACSKCVSRLRSVLKDQRCVYCQVRGCLGGPAVGLWKWAACCWCRRGQPAALQAAAAGQPVPHTPPRAARCCPPRLRALRLAACAHPAFSVHRHLHPPQVPSDSVYVTRFMGDYTEVVPPDEFDALAVRRGGAA